MEGRGGDGNWGLRFGQADATPLQMHWWLSLHGFPHAEVFEAPWRAGCLYGGAHFRRESPQRGGTQGRRTRETQAALLRALWRD